MVEKQSGPDFRMRLGGEKEQWQAAAKLDGIDQLGTWIKWVVRAHIEKQKKKENRDGED